MVHVAFIIIVCFFFVSLADGVPCSTPTNYISPYSLNFTLYAPTFGDSGDDMIEVMIVKMPLPECEGELQRSILRVDSIELFPVGANGYIPVHSLEFKGFTIIGTGCVPGSEGSVRNPIIDCWVGDFVYPMYDMRHKFDFDELCEAPLGTFWNVLDFDYTPYLATVFYHDHSGTDYTESWPIRVNYTAKCMEQLPECYVGLSNGDIDDYFPYSPVNVSQVCERPGDVCIQYDNDGKTVIQCAPRYSNAIVPTFPAHTTTEPHQHSSTSPYTYVAVVLTAIISLIFGWIIAHCCYYSRKPMVQPQLAYTQLQDS